ncbi:MAG: hypothetical protein GY711_32855 [bacterium]|nr:hypothetical protein [bacterium]
MDEFAGDRFVILVGPSLRLGPVAALLPALGRKLAGNAAPEVRALRDLWDLTSVDEPLGRAILDADEIAPEDLGLVRRFLDHYPQFDLWLTGASSETPAVRRLATHPSVRWVPWPLDVDQLTAFVDPIEFEDELDIEIVEDDEELAELEVVDEPAADAEWDARWDDSDGDGEPDGAADAGEQAPVTWNEPAPNIPRLHDDPEMAAIADILASEPLGGPEPDADAPDSPVPTYAPQPAIEAVTRAAEAAVATERLPSFYREQVADLADIVQRLRLTVGAARAAGDAPSEASELARLDGEVARLQQFTRTLGYLVSPPARGTQEFDVAILLEEMLGTLAGSGQELPRFLFRGTQDAAVRSDKSLLVQAFDALLQVAAECADADDTVRVSADTGVDPSNGPRVVVRVSFPAGPLAGMAPLEILRPYALKRELPTIGPNALAAAAGIVRGQGGEFELTHEEEARLVWIASLPHCRSEPSPERNGHDGEPPPPVESGGPFG